MEEMDHGASPIGALPAYGQRASMRVVTEVTI